MSENVMGVEEGLKALADEPEKVVQTESTDSAFELDTLVPRFEHNAVQLGKDPSIILIQKPLSFFGKMELFATLAGAMDDLLSGENPISLADLMAESGNVGGDLTMEDFTNVDVFGRAILKLVEYAGDDLLAEIFCISLGVGRGRREFVKTLMNEPVDDGGLSDEDGAMILETFIDQNALALVRFFEDRLKPILTRARKRLAEASQLSKH